MNPDNETLQITGGESGMGASNGGAFHALGECRQSLSS